MSWGLARPDTAMECRERSVESFESGVLYAPVERSFDVREVAAYRRKRSALLSERDATDGVPSRPFCALRERRYIAGTAGPAHRPAGRALPCSGRLLCGMCGSASDALSPSASSGVVVVVIGTPLPTIIADDDDWKASPAMHRGATVCAD